MNILILNGSPHVNGNTSAMVTAFTEGAAKKGHTVKTIQVGTKKINGCIACEYCHTKGDGACIQKDDMQEIYTVLETTDLLVFASPIYYLSWSGQLQSVVSRFYPMGALSVKKCALFLSSESPDVFDAPISQYHSMLEYFGSEDVGIYTAFGENNKSEKLLEQMRAFGASL